MPPTPPIPRCPPRASLKRTHRVEEALARALVERSLIEHGAHSMRRTSGGYLYLKRDGRLLRPGTMRSSVGVACEFVDGLSKELGRREWAELLGWRIALGEV